MGANNSTERRSLKKQAEDLQKQRQQLEAEKQRLEQQLALQQHWANFQLQEERRQKEIVEKWRRKQQQKDEYAALQRQLEELKTQQVRQSQQQITCQQQATAPPLANSWEFVDRSETVLVQQRVAPDFENKKMPGSTPKPACASPQIPKLARPPLDPAESAISFFAKEVVPEQSKVLSPAKVETNYPPRNCVIRESSSTACKKNQKPSSDSQPASAARTTQPPLTFASSLPPTAVKPVVPPRQISPQAKPEPSSASKSNVARPNGPTELGKMPKLESVTRRLETPQPTALHVPLSWKKAVSKGAEILAQARSCASSTSQKTQKPSTNDSHQSPTSQASVIANETVPKQQKSLPEGKQKPKKIAPTYANATDDFQFRYKEWSIIDYVSEENSISKATAENIQKLLDSNDTIPFIARYRKSMTQGLDVDKLRKIENSFERAKTIKKWATCVIKAVDNEGKWTPAFHVFVHESKSLADLYHIQSVFRASKVSDIPLGNTAAAAVAGENIVPLSDLVEPAIEGLKNEDQVNDSVLRIIADTMNKDKRVFDSIELLRSRHPIKIETRIADEHLQTPGYLGTAQTYYQYDKFVLAEKDLLAGDVSNICKGEAEKILSVNVNIPTEFDQAFKVRCSQLYAIGVNASLLHKELINSAIDYMYDTWTKPFIRKRIREEMKEKVETATVKIIVQNTKSLMLAPSVGRKVVIGFFTTTESVCKLAAVSELGDVLETGTIYPHKTNGPDNMAQAERKLVLMVRKYNCTSLALPLQLSEDTVAFLESLTKKNAFQPLKVSYTIVDDTGLTFYRWSRAACKELPTLHHDFVAAVSIARRLQDPVAELVKIDPKHLVSPIHQRDISEKRLTTESSNAIVDVVSSISVDANTASADLLKRVPGLNEEKAKAMIKWRKSSGPFANRNDLLKVSGIGGKIFEQCAGFIRIMPDTAVGSDGRRVSSELFNYLDQTSIHPESYDVAKALLDAAKCNVNRLGEKAFVFAIKLFAKQGCATLAEKFGTTRENIKLIVEALTTERATIVEAKNDVNANRITSTSVNPTSKLDFDNLAIGMVLTGVVTAVKPFGVFANVGVGRGGLIQKRHMNGTTLPVGQRVETAVNKIDKERRVYGLQLIKCI